MRSTGKEKFERAANCYKLLFLQKELTVVFDEVFSKIVQRLLRDQDVRDRDLVVINRFMVEVLGEIEAKGKMYAKEKNKESNQ